MQETQAKRKVFSPVSDLALLSYTLRKTLRCVSCVRKAGNRALVLNFSIFIPVYGIFCGRFSLLFTVC